MSEARQRVVNSSGRIGLPLEFRWQLSGVRRTLWSRENVLRSPSSVVGALSMLCEPTGSRVRHYLPPLGSEIGNPTCAMPSA